MSDVFLSYSRDDQATARRYAEALEKEGFTVWWDQSLSIGESFDQVTEQALAAARAVVVLWSKRSVGSRWVRAEATQAQADKRLAPVMIEPCKRPIMFELTQTTDLSNWNGSHDDPAWQSFIADLRRFVGRSALTGAASAPRAPAVPAPAGKPAGRTLRNPILWAAVAVVALGAAWWLGYGHRAAARTNVHEASIAVLPFKNFSPDPAQEYFADGITEEILNSLARIPDQNLKVTARTSAFAFKGRDVDLRDVGNTLGVRNILEGSVRKEGSALRITAQLIDAETGTHLWSDQFDGTTDDVFRFQEQIARRVADSMQVALGVGFGKLPGMTRKVDAFDEYLAASQIDPTTPPELRGIIEHLSRAVTLDPDFALAWGMLGDVYVGPIGELMLGDIPAEVRRQKADEAFAQVKRVAPESDLYYLITAKLAFGRGDWATYYRSTEKARQLAAAGGLRGPDDLTTAVRLTMLGRLREALAALELLKARDPLNVRVAVWLGEAAADNGELDRAFGEFDRAIRLQPNSLLAHGGALITALATHDRARIDQRLEAGKKAQVWNAPNINTTMRQLIDQPAAALVEAVRMTAKDPSLEQIAPSWLAYFGDSAGAVEMLSEGAKHRPLVNVLPLMWRPVMRDARKTPQFRQFVRQIGLVDEWRAHGWPDLCKPVGSDDFECF